MKRNFNYSDKTSFKRLKISFPSSSVRYFTPATQEHDRNAKIHLKIQLLSIISQKNPRLCDWT